MTTGMERLAFMEGDWSIEAFGMGDDGEWVSSPLPEKTTIQSVFEGQFLQEDEVQMMMGDTIIRFFIMWSYDRYRETYRMVACDDAEGLMDVLEGGFVDDSNTIVVSNINTGTAVMDEEGNSMHLRLTSTQNNPDSFTDEMHESADGGKSWLPVYRAVHSRKV